MSTQTIDEYIDASAAEVREKLKELRDTVRQAAPAATERIAYGVPTFYHNGNLVHFAAFKHHIGFYPEPTAIDAFKKDLARYKSAKGSVQFPLDEPLPLDLIARIVQFRVAENERRGPKAPKNKRK